MSISHKINRTYTDRSGLVIQNPETVTGDAEINYDASLSSGTNVELHLAFTQANLQSLCLFSSTAATFYTNAASGSSPQDTIALVAGQTLVWTLETDGIGKCPFSNNVTAIFVTNASATNISIRSVVNQ